MERASGGVRRASDTVAAHGRSVADMQGEIQRRLATTGRKEIVVFVHGYNNSFEDAARSAGSIRPTRRS
jgi:esterase/lipase superfamily enzyme